MNFQSLNLSLDQNKRKGILFESQATGLKPNAAQRIALRSLLALPKVARGRPTEGAARTRSGTCRACSGTAAAGGARGVPRPSWRHRRLIEEKKFTVRIHVPQRTRLATSWASARFEEEGRRQGSGSPAQQRCSGVGR
jgi:hypothetical protein